jgi:tRNA1(Val) A37 N6-methylase TrmN6
MDYNTWRDISTPIKLNYNQIINSLLTEKNAKINSSDFTELIKTGKITYPYHRYFVDNKHIHECFKELKKYNPTNQIQKCEKYFIDIIPIIDPIIDESYLVIKQDQEQKTSIYLSNFFNENIRLEAKRCDYKYCPMEYLFYESDKIFNECINFRGAINMLTLRHSIYFQKLEVTRFNPTLIIDMSHLFGAKKIIDFTAGYGDRLVGAMSKNLTYYGIDINFRLKPGHEEMVNFFSKESKSHVAMYYDDARNHKYRMKEKYDLIFTSPPYFNCEQYEGIDISTQYKNEENWVDDFLIKSIKNAIPHLKKNGHIALALNHSKMGDKYIYIMLDRMKKNKIAKYLGIVSYISGNKNKEQHPIFIWSNV